ncbi:MAG: PilN domain-containing protein [Nitrospiraceae bacterium]|nr:PilN domain-containing protein [Nitrospiraceae bacterium]
MIKINLLPTKKKAPKKVTDLQQQLFLAVLVIVLTMIVMWFFWKNQRDRIATLEKENITAQARVHEQENMLKEVKNVEEERKKVSEKIDIIEKLKKNQAGPVRLLDELSKALPKGVNIVSLTESNNNINIEGTGFSNDDIVRFVENLKASRFLSDVNLLETSQAKQESIDIYRYKLQFVYKGL